MSTLDIYTQLRDALQQVQEGFESQVAVEDLAARAAALDAEEAELDAAGGESQGGTARSRGDELFNLKGANASSDQ